MTTLGQRIKYFRNRANYSQLKLENEMGMSPGQLSRIENSEINPTKETLIKIEETLKLNLKEYEYLLGITTSPITQSELQIATSQVSEYFSQKGVFAYILDDRWRVLGYSSAFKKFFNFSNKQVDIALYKTIIQLMIDESFGIKDFLDNENLKEMLYFQLSRYHAEVAFMEEDETYKETLKAINNNRMASILWEQILGGKRLNYHDIESRIVYFKISGLKVKMQYSREPLQYFPRFEVVEFTPTNRAIKLLSKF